MNEKLLVKPIRLTQKTWDIYTEIAQQKGLTTGSYIRMILLENKEYQNRLKSKT